MSTSEPAARPLSPAIGVELDGVDIAAGVDAGQLARLREALTAHQLVVLRGHRREMYRTTVVGETPE